MSFHPPVRPSSAPPPDTSAEPEPDNAPAEPQSDAVPVRGFGCKGEGKDGNYGVRIPPPTKVDPSDLPFPYETTTVVRDKCYDTSIT